VKPPLMKVCETKWRRDPASSSRLGKQTGNHPRVGPGAEPRLVNKHPRCEKRDHD
jgi:hypothetical protein